MAEAPTERTRVRRLHQRGAYDRETLDAILDDGLLCHVGFVVDGAPVVTPTLYWREGDHVYFHGSSKSRTLREAHRSPVCLTVTLLDGLVLARSGFHHSVNYRSVMLFGVPEAVDELEKEARLEAFVERVVPGRWAEVREPSMLELRATGILALAIDEASAKVRSGPPKDDEGDYDLPVWAGEVPLRTVAGAPVPDPRLAAGTPIPPHLEALLARLSE